MPSANPFSKSDIELLKSKNLIDRKNQVQSLIFSKLSDLGNEAMTKYKKLFSSINPKVSKGENLENYPYLVLDYPRHFSTKDIFAFRTLIWWGNYVCFTLHLKGKYLPQELNDVESLLKSYPSALHISLNGDEWSHDINSLNYKTLENSTLFNHNSKEIPYLKICAILSLEKLNDLEQNYHAFLEQLIVPLWNGRN